MEAGSVAFCTVNEQEKKMKKAFIVGLFLVFVGLMPVSAETWEEFIKRVEIMEYNFGDGLNRGNQNTWSVDKWGALFATAYWLEIAYEDIYKNCPGLSQEQKQIYKRLWDRHRIQSDDLTRLFKLTYATGTSTARRIVDRWDYWTKHLENGGTIKIN